MTRTKKLISPFNEKWRKSDPLPSVLEEWYGSQAGSSEVISHLPDPVSIQDAIGELMKKSSISDNILIMKIKSEWEDIVGRDITAVSTPKLIKNGILYVEVENSVWMMELRGCNKKIIIDNIQALHREIIINDIIFVPSG
jgi:predicted nucleic acid-binding Zn ribbon protein